MDSNFKKYSFFGVILILISIVAVSCKPDKQPQEGTNVAQLNGKWQIAEAYRSGNKTNLLDNGYFEFTEDGFMLTNIYGDDAKRPFTFDEGIVVSNNEKFIVSKLTSDTLIIDAHLEKFDFKFVTTKKE